MTSNQRSIELAEFLEADWFKEDSRFAEAAALLRAIPVETTPQQPVAFLKEWMGEQACRRVDLTGYCEPWLKEKHPKITPLYAHPLPPFDDSVRAAVKTSAPLPVVVPESVLAQAENPEGCGNG